MRTEVHGRQSQGASACFTWQQLSGFSSEQAVASEPNLKIFYKGGFSTAHRRLKYVSLANTFISVCAAPIIMMTADLPPAASLALASSVAGFGILTTGALHWYTSPYVHEASYNSDSGEVEVETLTLFAGARRMRFHLSEVKYPDTFKPMSNFEVRGRPLFMDTSVLQDDDLRAALSPAPPKLNGQL